MTGVLIVLAIITAVALLFWLDRRDKNEKAEIERIHDVISSFLEGINWNMSHHRLRETFKDKEFLEPEDIGDLIRVGYRDRINGEEVLIGFYLRDDKLVKTDLHIVHMSRNRLNPLFRRLYERYGPPFPQNESGKEGVLWDLEKGILTLETRKDGTPVFCFWNRDFYGTASLPHVGHY